MSPMSMKTILVLISIPQAKLAHMGTGKNKKNGNIFERWKCYDCQGFGLKSCPSCGQGRGLTPEQRGER
ncbi:hypothetical protein RHGRI_017256 [Rhododendron griersonianum]|uniref:RanBP2-type domain-containing protein n=1 Tax=Rhododendron griersonianum TaxID=479676 RepID=A0AAV6JX82_9ERIC|nr:hypothetical protein RHGRI_017256 [Rhododendron griersonianum]